MKIFKRIISLLLLVSIISINIADAYTFKYNWSNQYISNSLKTKVDNYVSKKINTHTLNTKYLNILKKVKSDKFSTAKKALLNYFLLKLENNEIIYKEAELKQAEIDSKIQEQITDNEVKNTETQTLSPQINNTSFDIYEPIKDINDTVWNIGTIYHLSDLSDSYRTYISKLTPNIKKYYETNNDFEFLENWSKYRIRFKRYYTIDFSNPVDAYNRLDWINNEALIYKWWAFILTQWWFTIEKKLKISEVVNQVKTSTTSEEPVIFNIEWNSFYAYLLFKYKYYSVDDDWMYLSDYPDISNISETILAKNKWKYMLIIWYEKVKILETEYLKHVYDPKWFLTAVWKDLVFLKDRNITDDLIRIQEKTKGLTQDAKSDNEKIENIYKYLTSSITYDQYSLDYINWKVSEETYNTNANNDIYTWIWIFRDKNWVCDWFSKLGKYMLEFAWIKNVTIESWKADIWGSKTVPHAWLKIWTKLYDPTWDIYTKWDKTKYKWYNINPDEFYKTHFIWQ